MKEKWKVIVIYDDGSPLTYYASKVNPYEGWVELYLLNGELLLINKDVIKSFIIKEEEVH